MGRLGVMLVHDGWYGGERFMEASWVYRMSHPAHEDANTAYGQLAWLGNRGGGAGFGAGFDTCAPAAFWPAYPHVGSEATDCGATTGTCEQEYDVGIFLAAGLGGQYVVMHPGLDMVLVGHNAPSAESLDGSATRSRRHGPHVHGRRDGVLRGLRHRQLRARSARAAHRSHDVAAP
jgi:hypothetical protein